jgi:hypothetical protein
MDSSLRTAAPGAYAAGVAGPEAPLEQTDLGLACRGKSWFVVDAREVRRRSSRGRGRFTNLGGDRTSSCSRGGNPRDRRPAGSDDDVLRPGRAVDVVPALQRPLDAGWSLLELTRYDGALD